MRSGVAMAIHAPCHRERRDLLNLCHLIDATMTCLTSDALVDVNRVIEVDEIGQLRHAPPGNRPARGDALPDGRHRRARHPQRCMTADALLRWRQSGKRAAVRARMAVSTIDAQGTGVQSVIERHGLDDRPPFTARPRRTDPQHGERWYTDRNRDQRNQRASRDESRAWREECRHQLANTKSPAQPRGVEGHIGSAYIAPEHGPCSGISFASE